MNSDALPADSGIGGDFAVDYGADDEDPIEDESAPVDGAVAEDDGEGPFQPV